jgi:hypothetical protein
MATKAEPKMGGRGITIINVTINALEIYSSANKHRRMCPRHSHSSMGQFKNLNSPFVSCNAEEPKKIGHFQTTKLDH